MAKKEKGTAASKPRTPKAEKEPKTKVSKPRKRVLEDRVSKDGKQVVVLVYVPREYIKKVMDREALGGSFGATVRGYLDPFPDNLPQAELPEGLVGRGVYLPKETVPKIAAFEKDGGNLDAYVWSRLKRKLGIGGSD